MKIVKREDSFTEKVRAGLMRTDVSRAHVRQCPGYDPIWGMGRPAVGGM